MENMPADIIEGNNRKLYTPSYFIACSILFLGMTSYYIFVLFPLYLEKNGFSLSDIGLVMGVFSISAILIKVRLGKKMDKRDARFFVLAGLAGLFSVSIAYMILPPAGFIMGILRVMQGAFYGSFFTGIFTWTSRHSPPDRLGEGIGIFGIAGLAPMAAGPLIGEIVVAKFSFAGIFAVAAACCLAGFLLGLMLPKDSFLPPREEGSRSFFSLLFDRASLPVMSVAFIFGTASSSVFSFLAPFAASMKIDEVGSFFTAYALSSILTRIITGRLSDRYGRKLIIVPALVFIGLGVGGIGIFPFLMSIVGGVLLGMGHGLIYPTMTALALEVIPEEYRGSAMSIFTAASDTGQFMGSIIYGIIAEAAGFTPMYLVAGIVVLCGLPIIIFFGKETVRNNKPGAA